MLIDVTKEELKDILKSVNYAEHNGYPYGIMSSYKDDDYRPCLAFYENFSNCYDYTFPWDDDFTIRYNTDTKEYLLNYSGRYHNFNFNFRILTVYNHVS